jgi:GAF domain-containing protein
VIARLGLHGHLGDPHLDAVVATVAAACDVPLAVVNIVTPDLQTYPAEIGVGVCSTDVPDELSFCAEMVRTGRGLVVADAPAHPVYGANPLVVAGVIGAYAGEPLVDGGHVIGALSIFDSAPREFTTQDLDILRSQARLTMAAVRLRALAAWDPLTGLSNRALLLESAQRALHRRADGQIVALLVLDVVGRAA